MMDPSEIKAMRMASDIANRLHTGQYLDEGKVPSILHSARVAGLVAIFGGRYQEIIAAWLHDVLEQNSHGETQLAYGLSSLQLPGDDAIAVYRMVKALTRDPQMKEEQLKDSLERIIDAPPGATLIKLCERMDNLTSPERKKDLKEYREETMIILAMLFGRSIESGYTQCHEMLKRCLVDDARNENQP